MLIASVQRHRGEDLDGGIVRPRFYCRDVDAWITVFPAVTRNMTARLTPHVIQRIEGIGEFRFGEGLEREFGKFEVFTRGYLDVES